MTGPIYQPQVIQQPGIGNVLANSLAGVLAAMQHGKQLQMQEQQFQIEAEKAAADIEESKARAKLLGTQDEEAKQKMEDFKQAQKAHEEEMRIQNLANQDFAKFLSLQQQGRNEDEARNEILAGQKDPLVIGALFSEKGPFANYVAAKEGFAKAQTAQVNAQFAPAQEQATLLGKQAQAEAATAGAGASRASAAQTRIENRNLLTKNEPARVERFDKLWSEGMPAGQAAQIAGITLPKGVNPAAMKPNAGAQKLTDPQRRAQGALDVAEWYAPIIDKIVTDTKGGVTLKTQAIDDYIVGRGFQNPEQQQLWNVSKGFAQAWQYFVSGQQTTEQEFRRILTTTVPTTGDNAGTIYQKSLARQVMLDALSKAAQKPRDPEAMKQDFIGQAKALGVKGPWLNFLNEQYNRHMVHQRELEKSGAVTPSTEAGDTAGFNALPFQRP